MGIFDGNKSEQIKYLEDERKKLWERITRLEASIQVLEKEIKTRTPEIEKEAKEHSKRTSEYRNRAEQRLVEATELVVNLQKQVETSINLNNQIISLGSTISEVVDEVENEKNKLNIIEQNYLSKVDRIDGHILNIEEVFKKYPNLENTLTTLEGYIEKIEENQNKSSISLVSINTRKKQIDDLHRGIFGYKDLNEAGQEIFIDGTKNELEKAYDELSEELYASKEKVEVLNKEYVDKYQSFESSYKKKYEEIITEIRRLLPNALTAGLSSAFSKKKEDEVKSSEQLQKRFSQGINLLIGISILPVFVSIAFLIEKKDLEEVILMLPRIVLAIVPMYIPALWITYSSSKKLNLSKRLIEEYAHKEVLSRTYEGLSNQISNIKDCEQSEELRIRLLTNFLQASSENPGKLISNYETSDHPIMEALEQSYKFQIAVDKLSGFPGLGKISALIEKRAKSKLDAKAEKIEKALTENDNEEN